MKRAPIWVLFISSFLLLQTTDSAVEEHVKNSLIAFLAKLNGTTGQPDPSFGWNISSDPCLDQWKGVTCDSHHRNSVKKISLNRSSLSGVFDASSLCNVQPLAASLIMIKLDQNNIGGQLPAGIANCRNLSRLHLGHNRFSGKLPDSLATLKNLKRLDISYNKFSGNLPNLSRISGLTMFLAQYNQITGEIPKFDFSNLEYFNVSFNSFQGCIPDKKGGFNETSFMNNPKLRRPNTQNQRCLYSNDINSPDVEEDKKSKDSSKDQILTYSAYALLGSVFIGIVVWRLCKRIKKEDNGDAANKVVSVDESMNNKDSASSDYKIEASKSEFSAYSADSPLVSSSMIVLTSPVVNGLKFDDLLRAPAELLGRGKHGSLYKVILDNGMTLAVKRIKDWAISNDEFKQRMQRIYQANHRNVLPPLAYYCSKQEKLLVYEYQQKGNLSGFLQGTEIRRAFDWGTRLNVAASIAEALAFMHQELSDDGIAHGNLKSSNILLNKKMEPCISEYGLMVVNSQGSISMPNFKGTQQTEEGGSSNAFKADIHMFGMILLELLTGKLAQNNGMDLASWVHSVVREEWTVEVFDKSLTSEGASEERMLNLLQIAINCVNRCPQDRPLINQVAVVISAIKEEEERSVVTDP